jgi:hypothetical protein
MKQTNQATRPDNQSTTSDGFEGVKAHVPPFAGRQYPVRSICHAPAKKQHDHQVTDTTT